METACLPSGTSAHAPETAFCDRTNGVSTEKRVGRAGDGGTERAARDAAFSPARLKQGGCRVHAGGNRAEPDAIVARNSATEPGCLASHHALVDQRTAESSSTVSEFGCNGSEPKSCHTDSSARPSQAAKLFEKSLLPAAWKAWVRIQTPCGLHENVHSHLSGFV